MKTNRQMLTESNKLLRSVHSVCRKNSDIPELKDISDKIFYTLMEQRDYFVLTAKNKKK